MKKLSILFLSISMILLSCEKKDPIADQISKDVTESAMGNDLKYSPLETSETGFLTFQDYYDLIVKTNLKTADKSIDENITAVKKIVESGKADGNLNMYHVWKFNLEKLEDFKKAPDKSKASIRIVDHKYSIVNPMLNNQKVTVENFYFFDENQNLIGKASLDEMKSYKQEFIQHEKLPYYVALYNIANAKI